MPEAPRYYYICDACGDLVTIEDEAIADDSGWQCSKCGSHALWEFTDKAAAMTHAERIQAIVRSRLFVRRVKS